jgi:hypothetical protein
MGCQNRQGPLFAFGCVILIVAASSVARAEEYGFDVWTTANGLPQNTVTGVVQTPDGYLWLSTFDGLARFDGVRFSIFNRGNTKGIVSNRFSRIFADQNGGNAKGDISIVVFFDYFCSYCKKTLPALQALLVNDSSVRVVYKEFPILGPQSLIAAKASLAAARQGKFAEFHQAMLTADGAGDDVLKVVSERLGLDYARLQKDMGDPKIAEAIDRNIHLAESLNVSGTPAYLIGDQFIPGAIDSDALTRVTKDERSKLTKLDTEKVAATKGVN